MTAASPGTLGEVSGHSFSTRASLPPQVEALVDVIQDPIGQIEFLRKLIPPGFTSGCSSTPMTSPGWSGAEARAGVRPEHHEAVRLTAVPKGVPAAQMSAAQREQLRALLQVFVGRIPDELAEREAAKFAGDKPRDVYFAWADETERGQPHYYRLQASADKREPAADVPSARQGVVAIARNVSAETNATGRLSSRRMNGRAGFGFSNPTGGSCDWQACCDLSERDAQPVVDAVLATLGGGRGPRLP